MTTQFQLGDFMVEVVFKDIKNIHLGVYPPTGRVRISAPSRMSLDMIRIYAISKLGWIKKQQEKFRTQERESPREYLDRESHFVWGKRYLLQIIESDCQPTVELQHNRMYLTVRPGTSEDKRQAVVAAWYREQIRITLPPLISKWEPIVDVEVERIFIQQMKTKWGSCNPIAHSIRLNTELARKPHECLEYILVHEMVHMRERTHNSYFVELMDQFMPMWRHYRDELNRLPLRHEDWAY